MNRSLREPARDIPTVGEFDVAVVGGGTAGVMAAVGASRAGAKTCLVERSGTLGGALSVGIVGHFYNRFRDGEGRDLVGGAPRELLERLVASGGTPYGDVEEALGNVRIFFRHEYAGVVCLQMVREAGVDLWLQTRFCRALPAPGGGYDLIIESKSGREAIRARQVVDASGEADVAASAGAEKITEGNRSWGLLFEMENVDAARYTGFIQECDLSCPEFTPWLADYLGMSIEELRRASYWRSCLDGQRGKAAWPFRRQIMRAVDAGDLALIGDIPGGGQIRYGWDGFWPETYYRDGKAFANVCMITGLDPCNGRDVSRAEVAARLYAFGFLRFLRKYIPGFEQAAISAMAGQTMPRGGRTIDGHTIIADGDFADRVIHDDAICIGIQRPERPGQKVHGLPLGMFVPKGVDDLLVAGKCAAGGYAVRGTVYCMTEGLSCGIVSALAAKGGMTPIKLERGKTRRALVAGGVILSVGDPVPGARKLAGQSTGDVSSLAERKKRLS